MKKLFAIGMSALMFVSLSACGKKAEAPNAAPAEEPKEEKSAETAKTFKDEDMYKSTVWKAVIPKNWVKDEENSREDETSSDITYKLEGGEDMVAEINVWENGSPDTLRQEVLDNGYTLEDFKDKKIEGGINVGSYYGLVIDYDNKKKVFIRDEGKGYDAEITLPDLEGDNKTVLDSFTFTAEDKGKVDPPYPFDGTPYEATVGSKTIGNTTVGAEFMKLDPPFTLYDVFGTDGTVYGDNFYLLYKDKVNVYSISQGMKLIKEIALDDDYEHMDALKDGRIYVSSFSKDTVIIEGTEKTGTLASKDNLILSSDGTWGVEYFVGMDQLKEVTIGSDGTINRKDLKLVDGNGNEVQKMASKVYIVDDKIFVSGGASDDSGEVLCMYDKNGKLLKTLKNAGDEPLGSITGVVATKEGYFASDGNMRELYMWNKDGKFMGSAEDSELFGTNYPWLAKMFKGIDGNCYIVMTEQREDKSSNEVLLFKLTGLF